MSSDAAVEWWARVQARMVKPGEIAVVPQMPSAQADPDSTPDTVVQEHDPPSEWWAAFFAAIP